MKSFNLIFKCKGIFTSNKIFSPFFYYHASARIGIIWNRHYMAQVQKNQRDVPTENDVKFDITSARG